MTKRRVTNLKFKGLNKVKRLIALTRQGEINLVFFLYIFD